jgi:hypothetical protein
MTSLHTWGKQANNDITDAGLTLPGLEPMIYHTWGKQANNDITDAGLTMSLLTCLSQVWSDVIVSLFVSSVEWCHC